MVWVGIQHLGGVEYVGDTPIKTQFFSVCFTPIIPLKSSYIGKPTKTSSLLEAVAGWSYQEFDTIQLRYINRKSLGHAYLRAGCIWAFPLSVFGAIQPQVIPFFATVPFGILSFLGMLAIPVTLLIWSYKFGRQVTDQNQLAARQIASSILGLAFDPRDIESKVAEELATQLDVRLSERGITHWGEHLSNVDSKDLSANQLLFLRLRCAFGKRETREDKKMLEHQANLLQNIVAST